MRTNLLVGLAALLVASTAVAQGPTGSPSTATGTSATGTTLMVAPATVTPATPVLIVSPTPTPTVTPSVTAPAPTVTLPTATVDPKDLLKRAKALGDPADRLTVFNFIGKGKFASADSALVRLEAKAGASTATAEAAKAATLAKRETRKATSAAMDELVKARKPEADKTYGDLSYEESVELALALPTADEVAVELAMLKKRWDISGEFLSDWSNDQKAAFLLARVPAPRASAVPTVPSAPAGASSAEVAKLREELATLRARVASGESTNADVRDRLREWSRTVESRFDQTAQKIGEHEGAILGLVDLAGHAKYGPNPDAQASVNRVVASYADVKFEYEEDTEPATELAPRRD